MHDADNDRVRRRGERPQRWRERFGKLRFRPLPLAVVAACYLQLLLGFAPAGYILRFLAHEGDRFAIQVILLYSAVLFVVPGLATLAIVAATLRGRIATRWLNAVAGVLFTAWGAAHLPGASAEFLPLHAAYAVLGITSTVLLLIGIRSRGGASRS